MLFGGFRFALPTLHLNYIEAAFTYQSNTWLNRGQRLNCSTLDRQRLHCVQTLVLDFTAVNSNYCPTV